MSGGAAAFRSDHLPPGVLAIPCGDTMPTPAVKGIYRTAMSLPGGTRVHFETRPGGYAAARNRIVGDFLAREESEWLLMVDSDVVPTPLVAGRLLTSGKDVIGALSFHRTPPYLPDAGWYPDRGAQGPEYLEELGGPDAVRRVDWVGAGMLLVRRHVLYELEPPWFDPGYVGSLQGVTDQGDQRTVRFPTERNEDLAFCLKAGDAGFDVWCDTGAIVGHVGQVVVDLGFALRMGAALPRASRESQEARAAAVSTASP